MSVPHYWLGMVLVIVFAVTLGWLPPTGAGPGGSEAWRWNWEHVRHLILPAVTMSVIPMGIIARTVRALVAEILSPGVHRRPARQGPLRLRHLPPCREERRADGAGGDGHPARLPARRLDPDRDRVLLARHRAPAQRRHLPARPAAAAGHDPGAGDVLRACSTSPSTCCRRRSTRASSGADADARRQPTPTPIAPITRSPGYWATVWRRFRRDPVAVGARWS